MCLKWPTLSCANICRGLASTRQTRLHSPTCFARTRQTRRQSPTCFAQTCQTRQHLPKAISGKNVTRLDTFARVIRHSREFGASGHCLEKMQVKFLFYSNNNLITKCLKSGRAAIIPEIPLNSKLFNKMFDAFSLL